MNKKKNKILKVLESNYNLILMDEETKSSFIDYIEKNYSERKNGNLINFIESLFKHVALTDKEIIERLSFENMTLKAALDGVSLDDGPVFNPWADDLQSELYKWNKKKIPIERRQGYIDIFLDVIKNDISESQAIKNYNKINPNNKFKRSSLGEFKKSKRFDPLREAIKEGKDNNELLKILSN